MLFHKYPSFPSDVVLSLTTADASIQLCNSKLDDSIRNMSMDEFLLQLPGALDGYIVLSVTIRDAASRDSDASHVICETFKIAQRSRNAHAQVNSGFKFELSASLPGRYVCDSCFHVVPVCLIKNIASFC